MQTKNEFFYAVFFLRFLSKFLFPGHVELGRNPWPFLEHAVLYCADTRVPDITEASAEPEKRRYFWNSVTRELVPFLVFATSSGYPADSHVYLNFEHCDRLARCYSGEYC